MSSMDYNTNNYTITELLAILELDDPDSDEIMDTTNKLINQFSTSNIKKSKISICFRVKCIRILCFCLYWSTTRVGPTT